MEKLKIEHNQEIKEIQEIGAKNIQELETLYENDKHSLRSQLQQLNSDIASKM